jgi:hypothetical protein
MDVTNHARNLDLRATESIRMIWSLFRVSVSRWRNDACAVDETRCRLPARIDDVNSSPAGACKRTVTSLYSPPDAHAEKGQTLINLRFPDLTWFFVR